MSTNYILKKIDTASFQHHNSYQKQYAKKYKKGKNEIVYFAKEEWRKTGWTIDKIKRNDLAKERNKTRYVDSLRMGKQVRNASMSYNHIHCER